MRRAPPAALQDNVAVLTYDAAESGEGCAHRESPDDILHDEGKQLTLFGASHSLLLRGSPMKTLNGWINDLIR